MVRCFLTETIIFAGLPFCNTKSRLKREGKVKTIRIAKLKPNPAGKDRPTVGPLDPSQLAAEWVDIYNFGTSTVNPLGVELYNKAYSAAHPLGTWKSVLNLPYLMLGPAQTLRVHAGGDRGFGVIRAEDLFGVEHHVFTGRDQYVWNNRQGDTAGLWELQPMAWIDLASYDPNPPEGVILVRIGAKLLPTPQMYYRRRA